MASQFPFRHFAGEIILFLLPILYSSVSSLLLLLITNRQIFVATSLSSEASTHLESNLSIK